MKSNQKRNTLPFFKTATLWVALAMPMLVCAQIRIDWQQCYGSMGPDYGFSILPTNQGFAVLGQVEEDSPSGMYECNIYAPYRADWLIGIDTGISPDWQNCFSVGLYQKLCKAGDDTYYIAGLGLDYYYNYNLRVIQTDELGNILWIKYLGTAHGLDNCANNVFGSSTPDGGIIVATTIDEASGDVSQHFGGNDCWVVKLDTEGNIVWQTTLGTEGDDMVTCLQEAADGGLLLWINSDQTGNGNIGCGQPENKGVLVKIDALGQIQWNLCFERTSVVSIVEMEDGYLLAGSQRYTVEPNGNCGDGIYTYDCYLMKCDIEGNVIWDKEFGGSCNDKMVKVLHNSIDNGFTAFTNSKSTDGDVESFVNLGVTGADDGNIWMFHVNAEGELLWECCIGSQLGLWEEMRDVVALNDKEYAIVGTNTWFDGVSSGLVECSNNLLLPNSGSNIWALRVTDVYDYEQGEIIYRDFEPDSILIYWHKLGPVWIDLDADGEANDLKMQMWVAGEFCAPEFITGGSNITICTIEQDSINMILSEVAEENWQTFIGWSGGNTLAYYNHYGFRIQREDGYYYGWFETYNRVISGKNERHIAHFGFDRTAYCTIPNYPLRWGQIHLDSIGMEGAEWYYEIQNNDGSITYQHLECVGDTLFDRAGKRPKVIVRSNTHYDRDTITEVTHEYIYEEYGTVYWWNRDLQEFTTLYNLAANVGDEWEIKVGNETITMHVDTIENIEYEGHTYRTLHVSDPDDLFSGDIVCGFGHMTSFFPEQLMNRGKDFTVNGLRCYWIGDELIYHDGEEDCDAIHSELQSLDETDDAAFTVYPNPATGLVQIEGVGCAEVQVYNALGQIVKAAQNANEVSLVGLPQGVYLLRVTLKDGKVFSEKVVKE